MEEERGAWLSIVDYAQAKRISISTIRRYIKGKKVKYREEKGRYQLFLREEDSLKDESRLELELRLKIQALEHENRLLKNENSDLKTLNQFYESQFASPPDLPRETL